MKRIAIIGANEFQNPLITKAKQMGYETHVFAWKEGAIGEKTADFFYPISIMDKDKIIKKCKEIPIDAVVSIGSDLAVHTVNAVARVLGFPCNSLETDQKATDKYLMRSAFLKAGVPSPKFEVVNNADIPKYLDHFIYPLIVKPTDRSGSRGVCKVNTPEELVNAVKNANIQSFSKRVIIEEFIQGNEYSCECICWARNRRILAFTKKYTTGSPNFIETGHDQPADIPKYLIPKAENAVYRALEALDICWGAAHVEFKITPCNEIRIIEIGARMGGDCIGSDLVEISTGYDFLRMVIDVALGKEPDFKRIHSPQKAKIRFIMDLKDFQQWKQIEKEIPDKIWRIGMIHPIDEHKITDSSNRFGYYILHDKE